MSPAPDSRRPLSRRDYMMMLAVGAAAFILRIAYLISYSHSPLWDALVMDPGNHWDLARAVAEGRGLGPYAYFRAPLYIYTLAGSALVFGDTLWPIRILQALLGSLTAAMTAGFARRFLSLPAAALAGALMALYWIPVYFDGELLITSLFAFLGLAALILVWEADQRLLLGSEKSLVFFGLAGLVSGLASLARPNILVFAAGVVIALLMRSVLSSRDRQAKPVFAQLKKPLSACALYALGIAVCVAPVTVRNLVAAEDFVLISSQGGINFWLGNHQGADGRTVVVPFQRRDIPLSFLRSREDHPWLREDVWLSSAYGAEIELRKRVKESEISSYWYSKSLEWMAENPSQAAALLLKKTLYLFQAKEVSNNRDLYHHRDSFPILRILSPLSFRIISPLILAGLLVAIFKIRSWFWPLLFVSTYSLTVIAFFVTTRYRVPLLAVGMMLAALFVEQMVGLLTGKELASKRRLARLVSLGLFLALSAAVVNMPWPKWNDRPLRAAMRYNLGIALFERGELDSAAREFEATLMIKDFYPEARFWLGKVLADSGKVREAADEFEKSIALAPGYAPAHYELSLLYLKMSKQPGDEYYQKARAEMETAHRLAPGVFPKPK